MPRWPKPPGHQRCRPRPPDARRSSSAVRLSESTQRTTIDAAVRPAGVAQRLGHRQVGVGQLDVLADERDLELRLGALDALDELAPGGQVGRLRLLLEAQLAHDEVAQAPVARTGAAPRRSSRPSAPG